MKDEIVRVKLKGLLPLAIEDPFEQKVFADCVDLVFSPAGSGIPLPPAVRVEYDKFRSMLTPEVLDQIERAVAQDPAAFAARVRMLARTGPVATLLAALRRQMANQEKEE